jgi:hypothetical protein
VTPGTRFKRVVKTCRFLIFRPFRGQYHTVLGVPGRFSRSATLGTRFERVMKTHCFLIFWSFSWAIAHSFGVPGRFSRFVTRKRFDRVVKTRCFLIFRPFSWAIPHNFRGSGPIFTVRDPRYTIYARRENSPFSHISAVFVGNNTQFFGFRADFHGL